MKYFQQSIWIGELKKNQSQSAQHCLPNHLRPGHGASSTQKQGHIYQLHLFLWASLPSGSKGFQMISGPNLCSKKLKGFNTVKQKNAFWGKISLLCDTVTLVLAQYADWFTDRGHHLSTCYPKQYNWYLGIYAPNSINNYSEKTVITFQIKMLFPSVNSSIQPQQASLPLLGEDKLKNM